MPAPVYIPVLVIGAPIETPTSTTVIAGSVAFNYVEITSDYDVLDTDVVVNVTNNVSISLPTAVGITGRNYFIKNSTAGNVKVLPFGGEEIDGVSGTMSTSPLEVVRLTSDGENWIRV